MKTKRNAKLHEQTGEMKLKPMPLECSQDAVVDDLAPGWADKLGQLMVGAEEPKQYKRSPESRQKMSESQRKRWAKPRG